MDLCETTASAVVWAHHEFGAADFGDKRLTTRIQTMAAAMAENPAGKATDVFRTSAELEAAYRFVINERVTAEVICEAMCAGMLRRCTGDSFVYIALDGSSLKLAHNARRKNFCAIGAYSKGARGLKAMAALGVNQQGVTLGLSSLHLRVRGKKKTISHKKRALKDKETRYWAVSIRETIDRWSDRGRSDDVDGGIVMALRMVQMGRGKSRPLVVGYMVFPSVDARLRNAFGPDTCIIMDDSDTGPPLWEAFEMAFQQAGVEVISRLGLIGFSAGCQRIRSLCRDEDVRVHA